MITSTVTPKLDLKLEKNSKGFNFEIKLSQADADTFANIDNAINTLDYVKEKMEERFGSGTATPTVSGGAR
ncbi:hypothetical protein D3C72_1473160 [compost metagenome]